MPICAIPALRDYNTHWLRPLLDDKDNEMHLWDTIKDFYAERGGEFSGEQDMGVWHWDDIQIFDYPRRISPYRQPVAIEAADESYLAFTAECSDRMRVSVVSRDRRRLRAAIQDG